VSARRGDEPCVTTRRGAATAPRRGAHSHSALNDSALSADEGAVDQRRLLLRDCGPRSSAGDIAD